jgi:hypothetical protein
MRRVCISRPAAAAAQDDADADCLMSGWIAADALDGDLDPE